jgi:hypothetical protein
MATDSPQSTTIPSFFSIPIIEKLSKSNYCLWQAQILSPIHITQIEDLLLGVEKALPKTVSASSFDASSSENPNPEYARWLTRDHALLEYLLSSVTREVLMGITTAGSSTAACSSLHEMYGSHTRARSINTRITLTKTRKGTAMMSDYFATTKNYADGIAASG